jgi:hypothetical protein
MATVPYTNPERNPVAYFAAFDGQQGQALRDMTGTCWFLGEDGTAVLLRNGDVPFLQLLGRVDLAEEQRLLDELHGGLYELVDYRNSHRPVAA